MKKNESCLQMERGRGLTLYRHIFWDGRLHSLYGQPMGCQGWLYRHTWQAVLQYLLYADRHTRLRLL